ncbi:hypothetical protein ACH5RR_017516 [Cinchona calisaya]|uniref:Cystatin domain-containing protein n=1 Tax=Cinchona calisaya TaxID=153742 RepID=A0ABD2ZLQ9_9GENT
MNEMAANYTIASTRLKSLPTTRKPRLPAGRGRIPIPKPVMPTDPHVIYIGEFAVNIHSEQAGTNLVFANVVGCVKWNVFAAAFDALIIKVNGPKGTYNGKAQVAEAITGHKKLIYWKE